MSYLCVLHVTSAWFDLVALCVQPYASVMGGLGGVGAGGAGVGAASPRMLSGRDQAAPLTLSTIPLGRVNVVATKFVASVSSDATVSEWDPGLGLVPGCGTSLGARESGCCVIS